MALLHYPIQEINFHVHMYNLNFLQVGIITSLELLTDQLEEMRKAMERQGSDDHYLDARIMFLQHQVCTLTFPHIHSTCNCFVFFACEESPRKEEN